MTQLPGLVIIMFASARKLIKNIIFHVYHRAVNYINDAKPIIAKQIPGSYSISSNPTRNIILTGAPVSADIGYNPPQTIFTSEFLADNLVFYRY